jgi:hypothetical protein
MDQKKPTASKWTDRSNLRTRDDIEMRIRQLTAHLVELPSGERDEATVTEVEVLAAAAFLDPVATTPRGEMPLSRALLAFSNSPTSDFKRIFVVGDYGRDFDQAYGLAREVVGKNVAFALMEDVLTETGDPIKASMLVIERMISPASRFRKYAAKPPSAPGDHHPALA